MAATIAFLAGLGAGYADQKDRNREQERRDAEMAMRKRADARQQAEFDFQQAERQRAVADRQALRDAAAPIPVTQEELAGPVDPTKMTPDGQPLAAARAPMPTAYKVGAATFASQGLATDAAEQQRMARFNTVADQIDPAGAQARATQRTQGKVSDLQLKRMTQEAIKEGMVGFLAAAQNGASPQELEAIFNQNGDKKVSGLKVEPYVAEHPVLGKMQTARITGTLDDGTPMVISDVHGAGMNLIDAAKRFDLTLQAKRDAATAKYREGMLGVAQQNADSLEQQRKDAAAHQQRMEGYSRAAMAVAKQSGVTWNDGADKVLLQHYTSKGDKEGDPQTLDGDGLQFSKVLALSAAQRFGGDTTRAIGYAIDTDNTLRAAAAQKAKDSGGNITLEQALRQARAQTLQRLYGPAPAQQTNATGIANAPPGGVVRQGNQWVPQGSTPAAQAAQGIPVAEPVQAQLLDAARARRAAADAKFGSFGSRQRQLDPQGFAAAQQEYRAALQAEKAAEAAYQAALGAQAQRPSFATPTP